MGIAIDKLKASGFGIKGEKTSGMAYNGSVIFRGNNYRVMTIIIDQNNEDPEKCCTYADDAINMTPGSSEWDDFFGHYPVMLKNGVEGKKLNRNDFTKHEDGSSADITSGNEGDVMIAFPRRGVKISTFGNIVTVSMTDDPNKNGFEYNAHRRNDVQKDVFYLGTYKGSLLNGQLRSLSNKYPVGNTTMRKQRTYAQAHGKSDGTSSGYEQSGWFQLIFRQVMYLLKFKNLNSQSAIGYGYAYRNISPAYTGGTNTYGMDSELIKISNPNYMIDGAHQVKCLGIEDFWGNVEEWIDGIAITYPGYNLLTATTNFNDKSTDYENSGQIASGQADGFIKTVHGSTKAGFLIKSSDGSETTYFSDQGYLGASEIAAFGGGYNFRESTGIFKFGVGYADSYSNANGSRLMYL